MQFINLRPEEKNELLIKASQEMNISPFLIEKDFWVSWILNILFDGVYKSKIVFKGGTSLSKCYGLIQRFSEDIDLTLESQMFSDEYLEAGLSSSQRKKYFERQEKKLCAFLENDLKPALDRQIKTFLEPSAFSLTIDSTDPKNLHFFYPSVLRDGNPYIKNRVLLEIGIRGSLYPTELKNVSSYVDTIFSNLIKPTYVSKINTLKAERTFFEKLTLLHAECFRENNENFGDRLSRHYYDLYNMLLKEYGTLNQESLCLLYDVIETKENNYRCTWSNFHEIEKSNLTLIPNNEKLLKFEEDYKKMIPMIFSDIPDFHQVKTVVKTYQDEFNNYVSRSN